MTIIRHDFHNKSKSGRRAETEKIKIPGFQLRIELSYSSPPIWRIVNLPGTLTLAGLHSVIQICFDWKDEATHRFLVGKIFYSPGETDISRGIRSDAEIELHELEKDMGFIFSYLYDGGCGWECEITLEQLFPDAKDISHPVLVAADRACPPPSIEDIHEYQSLLAELRNAPASHEKILAKHDIANSFDPSYCDMTVINNRLKTVN